MPATNCVGFAGCGVPLNFTSVVNVCADDAIAAATQNTATIQAIFPNFSSCIQLSSSGFAPGKIAPKFRFLFTRDTSARRRMGSNGPKEKPRRPSWNRETTGSKVAKHYLLSQIACQLCQKLAVCESGSCGDSRPRLSDRAKLEGPYFVARTMLLGGAALQRCDKNLSR